MGICITFWEKLSWIDFQSIGNTDKRHGRWFFLAIFKLDVEGEIAEYFIGLDFFVEDKAKGSGWTKVSDKSEMGINNLDRYLK